MERLKESEFLIIIEFLGEPDSEHHKEWQVIALFKQLYELSFVSKAMSLLYKHWHDTAMDINFHPGEPGED